MSGVFVSYRRSDSAGWAGRIADRLATRFGSDQVFVDVDDIPVAADFSDVIARRLTEVDAVIIVIGPNWTTIPDDSGAPRLEDASDLHRREVATALFLGATIIPVLVGGAVMPEAADLPADIQGIARFNALEISSTRFETDVDRLLDTVAEAFGPQSQRTLLERFNTRWLVAGGALAVLLVGATIALATSRGGSDPVAATATTASVAGNTEAPGTTQGSPTITSTTQPDDPTTTSVSSPTAVEDPDTADDPTTTTSTRPTTSGATGTPSATTTTTNTTTTTTTATTTTTVPPPPAVMAWDAHEVAYSGSATGTFRQTGPTAWVEDSDVLGPAAFTFEEYRERDAWSIYLYDGSRSAWLRLDLHTGKVMSSVGSPDAEFELYDIVGVSTVLTGWVVSEVTYSSGGVVIGAFVMTGPGSWAERALPSEEDRFFFEESSRDDWSVYLYDESRDMIIQLDLFQRHITWGPPGEDRVFLYAIEDAR